MVGCFRGQSVGSNDSKYILVKIRDRAVPRFCPRLHGLRNDRHFAFAGQQPGNINVRILLYNPLSQCFADPVLATFDLIDGFTPPQTDGERERIGGQSGHLNHLFQSLPICQFLRRRYCLLQYKIVFLQYKLSILASDDAITAHIALTAKIGILRLYKNISGIPVLLILFSFPYLSANERPAVEYGSRGV